MFVCNSSEIIEALKEEYSAFLTFRGIKELLSFIDCGNQVLNLIFKQIEREDIQLDDKEEKDISSMSELLGTLFKSGCADVTFDDNCYNAYIKFLSRWNCLQVIDFNEEKYEGQEETAVWVVKNYKELKLSHDDVRNFIKKGFRANTKNVNLCLASLDFEIEHSCNDDGRHLSDVLQYAIDLNFAFDFFAEAYKKLNGFPHLYKVIADYIRKVYPNSIEAQDAYCKYDYMLHKIESPDCSIYEVIRKCQVSYKNAIAHLATYKIHSYYIFFLEELKGQNLLRDDKSVYDYYFDVVDDVTLKALFQKEPHNLEILSLSMEYHWRKGDKHAAAALLTASVLNLTEAPDKIANLFKKAASLEPSIKSSHQLWCYGLRKPELTDLLAPLYLEDIYKKEGIEAARELVLEKNMITQTHTSFFKKLLQLELEQVVHSVPHIRRCYLYITALDRDDYASHLEYLNFEKSEGNPARVASAYIFSTMMLKKPMFRVALRSKIKFKDLPVGNFSAMEIEDIEADQTRKQSAV